MAMRAFTLIPTNGDHITFRHDSSEQIQVDQDSELGWNGFAYLHRITVFFGCTPLSIGSVAPWLMQIELLKGGSSVHVDVLHAKTPDELVDMMVAYDPGQPAAVANVDVETRSRLIERFNGRAASVSREITACCS